MHLHGMVKAICIYGHVMPRLVGTLCPLPPCWSCLVITTTAATAFFPTRAPRRLFAPAASLLCSSYSVALLRHFWASVPCGAHTTTPRMGLAAAAAAAPLPACRHAGKRAGHTQILACTMQGLHVPHELPLGFGFAPHVSPHDDARSSNPGQGPCVRTHARVDHAPVNPALAPRPPGR